MYTGHIFNLADECIEAGCFPGLEGKHYVLLLRWADGSHAEIRRAHVNCLLPRSCRIWLAKGKNLVLLGDSAALPGKLPDGVRPPFLG